MRSDREWSTMFMLGLCVVMGTLLMSGCGQGSGDTVAIAAPPSNPNPTVVFPDPMPVWDMVIPGAERFIVLSSFGGLAVRDNETGLVWQKSPTIDSSNYRAAIVNCNTATITGARMGWRLPTPAELLSLVDATNTVADTVSLPPGHPFTNVEPVDRFWTLGTTTDISGQVFVTRYRLTPGALLPVSGEAIPVTISTAGTKIWCVRSGNPAVSS